VVVLLLLGHGHCKGKAATDYGSVSFGCMWAMVDVATWVTVVSILSCYGCSFFGLTVTVLSHIMSQFLFVCSTLLLFRNHHQTNTTKDEKH